MDILLTNDDGIQAVGLRAMFRALTKAGHTVHVVAPMTEQSAVGHAVTLSSPLRVKKVDEDSFKGLGVSGTPADCVKMAMSTLLDKRPDLIISGINNGANVGVDILYSGTVSAATEGALAGLPALAVSVDDFQPRDLSEQSAYAADFVARQDWSALPERCVLNLNFPNMPIAACRGLKLCPQTEAVYDDEYDHRTDPRGGSYYWLMGQIPPEQLRPESDRALLTKGYITLTPLRFDFTDWDVLRELESIYKG